MGAGGVMGAQQQIETAVERAASAARSRAIAVLSIENRYCTMHTGTSALGGMFSIDDSVQAGGTDPRFGFRMTCPRDLTPVAVWVYYSTIGTPGQVKLRVCEGLASDPHQPNLPSSDLRWSPTLSATPRWERI